MGRVNLAGAMVTVGDSKTEAGAGKDDSAELRYQDRAGRPRKVVSQDIRRNAAVLVPVSIRQAATE